MNARTPLLDHHLHAPSAFRPDDLLQAVRRSRGLGQEPLPPLCVLDFDGDLTDGLVEAGMVAPVASWACFHTQMLGLTLEGLSCGVIARTIGGPYAVLVAEQLHAAGVQVIVGITSAGRVSPALPLPSIVVADSAVRDEGTSLHYLPAAEVVATPTPAVTDHLARALADVGDVHRGLVWTTDAPYRETQEQLRHWAARGALAVEMQAASLFAFAAVSGARVGVLALVSNSVDHSGDKFDTGEHDWRLRVLAAVARGARAFLAARPETGI
jgi:uridine phosphorylase